MPGPQSRPEETLLAGIMSIGIISDDSRAGFTSINTISGSRHGMLIKGWIRRVAPGRQLQPSFLELNATDEDPRVVMSRPVPGC
jgi:hypothetical protein